jgi:hypothetical protein
MIWNVILFFILFAAHIALYPRALNPNSLAGFGDLMQALALLFAALQFTRVARKATKEEIHFLNFITLGLWIWVMSQGLLTYSELLLEKSAIGTVTDWVWVTGYGVILHALMHRTNQYMGDAKSRVQGSILIVILIIVLLSLWQPIRDPDRSFAIKLMQITFPFLDLWLSFLAMLLAWKSGAKKWFLVGFGSFIIGVTDVILAYHYTMSSPVYRYTDIPIFVGYSMWWLLGASLVSEKSHAGTHSRLQA